MVQPGAPTVCNAAADSSGSVVLLQSETTTGLVGPRIGFIVSTAATAYCHTTGVMSLPVLGAVVMLSE
jgi:hypothetical protein